MQTQNGFTFFIYRHINGNFNSYIKDYSDISFYSDVDYKQNYKKKKIKRNKVP